MFTHSRYANGARRTATTSGQSCSWPSRSQRGSAVFIVLLAIGAVLGTGAAALSQTTYHVHNEASSTAGQGQLRTTGPDVAAVALQSANLRSTANGEKLVKAFDTQAGVPGATGAIPSGATLTFQLWMRKTANVGTMFPRARVQLNSATGATLCTATGTTAITTTLTLYTISCATTANNRGHILDPPVSLGGRQHDGRVHDD